MASRKHLILEYNVLQEAQDKIANELYKRYYVIYKKHYNNRTKLEKYKDECPNCYAKMLFYQRLRELDEK